VPSCPQLPSFVGYSRVSTLKQSYGGLSLEGQQDAIKSYAKVEGNGLSYLHEDIKSGGGNPMLRPNLRDALKNAEQLQCAILVTSVSRLGRDMRVYDILVERGIPVWVVGEGKINRPELKARLRAARDWLA
jgi:DNA invertase Pin-like site-specific DNA recombinase